MWAATDLEKTRVLLANNAEVNARSDDLRTPLKIAAGRPGGAPIVKLLLDHVRLMLDHGADVTAVDSTGRTALIFNDPLGDVAEFGFVSSISSSCIMPAHLHERLSRQR